MNPRNTARERKKEPKARVKWSMGDDIYKVQCEMKTSGMIYVIHTCKPSSGSRVSVVSQFYSALYPKCSHKMTHVRAETECPETPSQNRARDLQPSGTLFFRVKLFAIVKIVALQCRLHLRPQEPSLVLPQTAVDLQGRALVHEHSDRRDGGVARV